ncbi:unnamed protein product, partial [Prunus brigantina]
PNQTGPPLSLSLYIIYIIMSESQKLLLQFLYSGFRWNLRREEQVVVQLGSVSATFAILDLRRGQSMLYDCYNSLVFTCIHFCSFLY